MPGSVITNEGGKKRKRRDGFKPDVIECGDEANNDEESEEEERRDDSEGENTEEDSS